MIDDWIDTSLGDVFELYNGNSIKPGGTGQYLVYGSNGIIGGSDEYKHENAIIIGRVGAYCGSVDYCSGRFWASDNTIVAKPNPQESHVQFAFYLLKTMNLNYYAGGAAQPLMTQTVLKGIPTKLPPLHIQRKIAGILSAYDDLIENNTRRIAILEEMAQRIYKEWFVDFRYPGHENDEMVESELGMIPEGWEVKSLMDSDYFKFIRTNITEFEGEKTYFATADVNGTKFIKSGIPYHFSEKPSRAQKQPTVNSVWFARMKDSFKVIGFTDVNSSFAENSMISSGFAGFQSDKEYFGFIYNTILSDNFHTLKDTFCTGATQMSLTNDGLSRIRWAIPKESLISNFSKIANPIIDKCLLLRKKNQILRQTRDLLLPKFISGKVDVSELDIDIGET